MTLFFAVGLLEAGMLALRADRPSMVALFFVFTAFFAYLAWKDRDTFRHAWQSRKWRPTHAHVVERKDNSFVIDGANQITGGRPVKYQETLYGFKYSVDGIHYISHCYSFGGHIDQIEAQFCLGDAVIIYYDPANPRRAVVRPGFSSSILCAPLLGLLSLGSLLRHWL